MKFLVNLKIITLLLLTAGCSIPFIGGPEAPEYREVFSIAKVHQVDANAVTFEITGHRSVQMPREEIPSRFVYTEGKEFYVRQQFLIDGRGEKYILEVLREVGQIL